ncbi:MAG: hypothetical protein EKK62_07720 [Acidimicrobiia bacterium]|nr:MAG: hypothetical protein EKK62_07720 [Acidimicrobiia bacterium]
MSADGDLTGWLAFDIGCIECGEESGVIGIYDTEAEAQAAADAAEVRQADDWHGQHSMEVFDLSAQGSFSLYAKDADAS